MVLMLWDVDDFKGVNDRFGHVARERVLIKITEVMAINLRETDFIARYGGEEFAVLLAGTEIEMSRPLYHT